MFVAFGFVVVLIAFCGWIVMIGLLGWSFGLRLHYLFVVRVIVFVFNLVCCTFWRCGEVLHSGCCFVGFLS